MCSCSSRAFLGQHGSSFGDEVALGTPCADARVMCSVEASQGTPQSGEWVNKDFNFHHCDVFL